MSSVTKEEDYFENLRYTKYLYDLPNNVRMELERLLNKNKQWENLVVPLINCDAKVFEKLKNDRNPAHRLLSIWAQLNHTLTELFTALFRAEHYEGLVLLSPFVDKKLHNMLQIVKEQISSNLIKHEKQLKEGKIDNTIESQIKSGIEKEIQYEIDTLSSDENEEPNQICHIRQISYNEITSITDYWDDRHRLSTGTFGKTFQANWRGKEVAVKKLEVFSSQTRKYHSDHVHYSFRKIIMISLVSHKNIVPLVAFCLSPKAPCLVYTLMQNGCLKDKLKYGCPYLSWEQRFRIARGIIHGLRFLHTCLEMPLYHGNLQSTNILLDNNMEPRLTDFNLGTDLNDDNINLNELDGIRPYLPDEFMESRIITDKVDSYSYGIVLYELATGQPPYNKNRKYLRDYIDQLNCVTLSNIFDWKGGIVDDFIYMQFIVLGKWSTARLAENRPGVELVLEAIEEAWDRRNKKMEQSSNNL